MTPPSPQLRIGTSQKLTQYVSRQLQNLFPVDDEALTLKQLDKLLPKALDRMTPMLREIKNFSPGIFDHFHTLQYASFLYLLSNEAMQAGDRNGLPERLFGLNRALNAIDLFFSVQMPEVFFLSHALGVVLGDASYGERLVVFQNVTVGRVGDARPKIGRDVVLYPGAQVTGAATVGDRCVIGAGVHIHGRDVPPDTVVLRDHDGRTLSKPRRGDYASLYFRSS